MRGHDLTQSKAPVREDAPLADQVRAWSEAVRRLSPARDAGEFTAAQATIAAGLRHLAARIEARA